MATQLLVTVSDLTKLNDIVRFFRSKNQRLYNTRRCVRLTMESSSGRSSLDFSKCSKCPVSLQVLSLSSPGVRGLFGGMQTPQALMISLIAPDWSPFANPERLRELLSRRALYSCAQDDL